LLLQLWIKLLVQDSHLHLIGHNDLLFMFFLKPQLLHIDYSSTKL
jgi:hypothetical protein